MNNDYAINSSVAEYAKEFNKNPDLTSSINGKLIHMDNVLTKLDSEMKELINNLQDTGFKREELENDLNTEIENIRNTLLGYLNKMAENLNEHHTYQRAESLKLQSEANVLKKEVLELYQKVTELTRRQNDMEFVVGQVG